MSDNIALTLANQAAEIERLKERVEKLEAFFSTEVSGTLHISDRSEMVPIRVDPSPESLDMFAGCPCRTCQDALPNPWLPGFKRSSSKMILCTTCGNKRCPHANHHDNACTGSNAPGQPGSAY